MSKIEQIIDKYPTIIALQKANFTLVEICTFLKEKYSIDICYNSLCPTISKIKNKTIHSEYDRIILISSDYDSVKIYEPYSIQFNGIWICFKDAPNIKKEWIITEKKLISSIPDPIGLIYAKRFLKAYHITNELLLNKYTQHWNEEIFPHQLEKIKLISENIKIDYDKIITELKTKSLNYILGN